MKLYFWNTGLMMEDLRAKIRQPSTTYFICVHHVKAKRGQLSKAEPSLCLHEK